MPANIKRLWAELYGERLKAVYLFGSYARGDFDESSDEALLNEIGLDFNKHSAVHAAFGKHFAQIKLLDPKFHRWLIDSFDKRPIGDYGVETNLQMDVVVSMIHQAQEFLETAKAYLGSE